MDRMFFVMLNTQQGMITPLIDEDSEEMAIFSTDKAAREAAENSILGHCFGFEVFESGRE